MGILARCFQCEGKKFSNKMKEKRFVIGELVFEALLEAQECKTCGQLFFHDEIVEKFEAQIARWLAENSVVTPESFKFMRKFLGLKARELAKCMRVSPETLSRWEGSREPDFKAGVLLGSLVLDHLKGEESTFNRLKVAPPDRQSKQSVRLELLDA